MHVYGLGVGFLSWVLKSGQTPLAGSRLVHLQLSTAELLRPSPMVGFSLGLPYGLSAPSRHVQGAQEAHLLLWVGAQPCPAVGAALSFPSSEPQMVGHFKSRRPSQLLNPPAAWHGGGGELFALKRTPEAQDSCWG